MIDQVHVKDSEIEFLQLMTTSVDTRSMVCKAYLIIFKKKKEEMDKTHTPKKKKLQQNTHQNTHLLVFI